MFGFPKQTLDEWADDLRRAIALAPEHLSAYSLMYEEGTPL
jgi:oxygen-independent coproporphyrinogen-3 oxidase